MVASFFALVLTAVLPGCTSEQSDTTVEGSSVIIVHLESYYGDDAVCSLMVDAAGDGQAENLEAIDTIDLLAGGNGTLAEVHPNLDEIDPLVDPIFVDCAMISLEDGTEFTVRRPVQQLDTVCQLHGEVMDCNFYTWDSTDEESVP